MILKYANRNYLNEEQLENSRNQSWTFSLLD